VTPSWKDLPEVQRVKVDAWLFEEVFTYEEVVEGCLREFGVFEGEQEQCGTVL